MWNITYKTWQEGMIVHFRVTGFATYHKIITIINDIAEVIKKMDSKKEPYKILFDLRGLKALDPRTAEAVKALDKIIYESSVVRVGTVLDSIIAKLQQMRVANEYRMPGRAEMFSNYDECLAWLKSDGQPASHSVRKRDERIGAK